MNTANVTVVIPNWNGMDLLGRCLDSLVAQNLKSNVIVVDNGSTDGSKEYIKKTYPMVRLIELDKNHGFAGGVNAGIGAALKDDATYIALLNNDAVADKAWLEQLVKTAGHAPKAGIVTSKILRSDKKHLDSTGDFYSIWGLPFPRGRNELDHGQYDHQTEIFGASGGASLYSAGMLEQIGLFDESFFAYFEDVDISFRAQLAGWKVQYQPKAVVYHEVGATSSKMGSFSLYHSSKNFMLLYAKNMPLKLYLKYLPFFMLQLCRWFITSLLRGKIVGFLKGLLVAIGLTPHIIKQRHYIQKSRTVSVPYIDSMLYHHRPPRPSKLKEIS